MKWTEEDDKHAKDQGWTMPMNPGLISRPPYKEHNLVAWAWPLENLLSGADRRASDMVLKLATDGDPVAQKALALVALSKFSEK